MTAPISHRTMRILALALAICALLPAWCTTAHARPIDDAALAVARGEPATPTRDLPTPVVTRTTPPADDSSDTLTIALSSTALLVALGGVGYIVVTGRRMRPPARPIGR
jgi:hypothetical protein